MRSARQLSTEEARPHPRGLTSTVVFVFAAHAVLAVLARQTVVAGLIHAVVTFGLGVWWAITPAPIERVIGVAGYIATAEVFWRMTGVNSYLPWEFGKYALIALMTITMLRMGRNRVPVLVLLFFALLLPSIAQTLNMLPLSEAREQIMFNLSGPLAITVAIWFFSNVTLTSEQIKRLLLVCLFPIVSIAMLTLLSILTAPTLTWEDWASSLIGSAWSGANQTSAVLGVGVFFTMLLLLLWNFPRRVQIALILLGTWFAIHSLLTFSRGGIFTAGIGSAAAAVHVLGDRRRRARIVLPLAAILVIFAYIIIPRLDRLTSGSFSSRYTSLDLTGRDELMQTEIGAFRQQPLWGVGPGMMKTIRYNLTGINEAAHTEYTRMLAEHGVFGLAAIVLLLIITWTNYRRLPRIPVVRGLAAALMAWTLAYMTHSATRLAVPALLMGLAFVQFDATSPPPEQSR